MLIRRGDLTSQRLGVVPAYLSTILRPLFFDEPYVSALTFDARIPYTPRSVRPLFSVQWHKLLMRLWTI